MKNKHKLAQKRIRAFDNSFFQPITGMGPDGDLLMGIYRNLCLSVSTETKFIDMVTYAVVYRNRLRCMLRYDYVAKGGKLPPKALNRLIDDFLDGLGKAAVALSEREGIEEEATFKEVVIDEKFI